MNIEDVKVGTRVVCLNDSEGVIPTGSWGTIVEDYSEYPYISWDDNYSFKQFCYGNHMDTYPLELSEIEKLPETHVPKKEIAKLTVSVSLEDKQEIAKDILKIVLKDLDVIITDAIDSLSNNSLSDDNLVDDKQEGKQPVDVQTVASNVDFSDEKLQSMFEEMMKDVMKEYLRDSINTLNKTAFGI